MVPDLLDALHCVIRCALEAMEMEQMVKRSGRDRMAVSVGNNNGQTRERVYLCRV